jgi:predicted N-acetyltransferase YhbS
LFYGQFGFVPVGHGQLERASGFDIETVIMKRLDPYIAGSPEPAKKTVG